MLKKKLGVYIKKNKSKINNSTKHKNNNLLIVNFFVKSLLGENRLNYSEREKNNKIIRKIREGEY